MFLHKNLRAFRIAFGFSQKDVADAIQIRRTTYQAYEDGRNTPGVVVLEALRKLYEAPMGLLLNHDLEMVQFDKESKTVTFSTVDGAFGRYSLGHDNANKLDIFIGPKVEEFKLDENEVDYSSLDDFRLSLFAIKFALHTEDAMSRSELLVSTLNSLGEYRNETVKKKKEEELLKQLDLNEIVLKSYKDRLYFITDRLYKSRIESPLILVDNALSLFENNSSREAPNGNKTIEYLEEINQLLKDKVAILEARISELTSKN
ncbi:helix-turn-helix transcriptional regulator [Chitinophaga cymbidii]|nr:helix-turn-helix transcriptional regulator [Chitinophaga cymbidii]